MKRLYGTLESASGSSAPPPYGDLGWTKAARSIKDFPAGKSGYLIQQESSSIGEDLLDDITSDWLSERQSSSTSVSNEDSWIVLEEVFGLAAGENFEDGVETEFSRRLEGFVKYHSKVGISLLQSAISKERFREQYIAEALLWIGDMEHENTKDVRRRLLENALDSESVFIKDAAVSGLSYLGDPKSISRLSKAQEEEASQAVRINIESVLKYLHKLAR